MNGSFLSYTYLEPLLGWLAAVSFITFILSLLLIPYVVGRLAEDCFVKLYHADNKRPPPSLGALILLIVRNVFGLLLVVAGIVMLFLPGQGLLTILLGSLLLSFPGKRKLLNGLVVRPKIQHSLNWLRQKSGKSPFLWP